MSKSGEAGYRLMPIRISRLKRRPTQFVVTSEGGEAVILDEVTLKALSRRQVLSTDLSQDLEARQIIATDDHGLAERILATKLRTRKSFLRGGPALHIFVVTLSCDHSCQYCQVSRTSGGSHMSLATAAAAVDRLFETPSNDLTVEFQGGEPLLALETVSAIIGMIESRNALARKNIQFTMTTTLHHFGEAAAYLIKKKKIHLSTSLDGPTQLHNANRPLPSKDSHARTVEGIARARAALGVDRVAALATITQRSLDYPEAIVDEYVRQGFRSVFLRPVSPYGFAARSSGRLSYDSASYLAFYERALTHILHLNIKGIDIEEVYASMILKSMLTLYPNGYVDLRSPVGAGFGTLVYNYDGDVYASDEGRMLAEMGDKSLRLGRVDEPYSALMNSDAMQLLASVGLSESLPGCADCAFVHYCGPDPAQSLSRSASPVDHKSKSDHCRRHTDLFELLIDLLHSGDPRYVTILERWAHGQPAVVDEEAA